MKSGSLGPTPSSMPSSPLQYGFPIAFPRSRGEHEFLKARAKCSTQEMRETLATRAFFSSLSSSHLSRHAMYRRQLSRAHVLKQKRKLCTNGECVGVLGPDLWLTYGTHTPSATEQREKEGD